MLRTWTPGSAVPSMTLGDAVERMRVDREYGPIACACSGGPLCCIYAGPQAHNLQRTAHILVKMIDTVAKRES